MELIVPTNPVDTEFPLRLCRGVSYVEPGVLYVAKEFSSFSLLPGFWKIALSVELSVTIHFTLCDFCSPSLNEELSTSDRVGLRRLTAPFVLEFEYPRSGFTFTPVRHREVDGERLSFMNVVCCCRGSTRLGARQFNTDLQARYAGTTIRIVCI